MSYTGTLYYYLNVRATQGRVIYEYVEVRMGDVLKGIYQSRSVALLVVIVSYNKSF